jgi:hypothetical protein
MSRFSEELDLDGMLALPASEILARLRSPQDSPLADDFNWRALGFTAAANARQAGRTDDPQAAECWGEIAVLSYGCLGKDESAMTSAMGVRAELIHSLGPLRDGGLRDPEVLYTWLREAWSHTSVEQATEDSSQALRALRELQDNPNDAENVAARIRPLRKIKNRLGVTTLLAGPPSILPDDIAAWRRIRSSLP